jgi:nitrous oxidase accessory protein NosD
MNSYYNLWEDNDSYNNRGGLALMEVRDQVVRNNRTWGNADHGIMLRTLQDSRVENNVVADNDRGSSSTTSNTRSCAATWSSAIRLASTFGWINAQRGAGQRLHRQPGTGALSGRAR